MNVKELKIQIALGSIPRRTKLDLTNDSNTPLELLVEFSKDKSTEVRSNVAFNPSASSEILLELSKDKSAWIRWCVSRNSSTPPEILLELSKDENKYVKQDAVKNPNFPKKR